MNIKLILIKKLSILLILLFTISGCGKNDDSLKNETTPKKTESKTETNQTPTNKNEQSNIKKDSISEKITDDTPIHYIIEGKVKPSFSIEVYIRGNNEKAITIFDDNGKLMTYTFYADGNTIYMINSGKNTKIGMKLDQKKFAKKNKDKLLNIPRFPDNCISCEKIDEEYVLGRHCIVYKDEYDTRFTVYNGNIILKIVNDLGVAEAKLFESNINLSDDFFIPPQDFEYINMDDKIQENVW